MDLRRCQLSAVIVAGLVGTASQEVLLGQEIHVKVMSFNIRLSKGQDGSNHWGNRRDLVFDVIRQFDGDFLGVQEAWPDQVTDLCGALSNYQHLVRSRNADASDGEATPLYYRHDRWQLDKGQHGTFWLSDTPEVPGSKAWWTPVPRIVTWGRFLDRRTGQGVYVFNTHFCHLSEWARRRSADLLTRRILARRHAEPVIVTGDFNAGESSYAVRQLKGELPHSTLQLIDTFRALQPDAEEVGTFNGFWLDRTRRKIDYVFASPEVKVLDARIVNDHRDGRQASDHYPVTAVLRFPALPSPRADTPAP
ncbi:MAG: endonuclease/exonuclease/phosphatase family protein [Thermoguttaceae bacterium]